MDDVAIIGVGLHPFGRFPGKTAIDMGAEAIHSSLEDAGIQWDDIQIAIAGSSEIGCADAVVSRVGMTGIPFHNVGNGCATAATALSMTADAIRYGQADIAMAVGLDKHPAGAFTGDPEGVGLPEWYGESGYFLTTLYFAMKIHRYMHDFDIDERTLAKVAAKNFRNGSKNPNAFRRKPLTEEQILESPYLNYPLRQYMYCAPDEGAAAVVLCRADRAREFTDTADLPQGQRGPHPPPGRVRGPESLDADRAHRGTDGRRLARRLRDRRDRARGRRHGPAPGHRGRRRDHAHGRERPLQGRRAAHAARVRRDRDHGRLPINTDGGLIANGEPIGASGLRQVYELVNQLRGTAGDRQVPNNPKVGYAQLYGAPGVAGVSILSR